MRSRALCTPQEPEGAQHIGAQVRAQARRCASPSTSNGIRNTPMGEGRQILGGVVGDGGGGFCNDVVMIEG